jgi:two-component system cell cycle sensor histidine kinase/response regulator CckA
MTDSDGPPGSLKREHDRLNRALRLAVASSHAIMQSTGEIQLLQKICNIAVEIGGYRMAWIGYVEYDEAKSIRPVTHAGSEKGYLESANLTWEDNERGRGPSGTAVRTGQFVISRNISTDPAFLPWRDDAVQRGFASSIALPLKIDGRTIGELAIYSSSPDAFDANEVEVLQELANDLGIGMALVRARHKRDIAEGKANALGVALKAAIVDSINNEILFRSIYENAPMGMVRFDSKWKILSVNAAYAQMLGYTEAELLKMTIMDLTHPEDKQITEDNAAKLGVEFKVLKGFEKRYFSKAGKLIWVRITGKKVRIAGHNEPNWLATVEDITDVRELESNLELERRKTLQSAKLATLGEMSAGIAHEINNPITIILGSLGLLERDRTDPEKFSEALSAVRRAGEKIAQIVSGLTKFSRRSEFSDRAPKILAEIVEDVANIIAPTAKRFATEIDLDLQTKARIVCNEIEIGQIIQNLLANGIDAVKSAPQKWVGVKLFESGDQVVLQVLDSGPGVAKGLEEKIFEAFYTTKPTGKGTGLGLSIVRGIVADHEATLELLKVDGHTCFELRFARHEA